MSRFAFVILLAIATGLLAADLPAPPTVKPALPPGAVRIGTTQFRLDEGWSRKVYFTADGKTIVSPACENVVELLDPETGRRTGEIVIAKSRFYDSAYHTKGNLLAIFGFLWPKEESGHTKPTIWIVDAAARKVVSSHPVADIDAGGGHSIRFTPDGKRLILGMDDQIRIWDVKSGEELLRQKVKRGNRVVVVSPDGKTIAFGQGGVDLWDWASGAEPKKLATNNSEGVAMVAFTEDGKKLLVASREGKVRKFDVATGGEAFAFNLDGYAWNWSLSPDGKTLAAEGRATGKSGQAVVLYDPATGKVQGRLPTGGDQAADIGWSADSARLTAASRSRFWVWDVKTGKAVGTPEPGHQSTINALTFGAEGQLFTASNDHTIRSWDAKTGKPGLTLTHDDWVRDVAVSPDGQLVAGSAYRNGLRLWDAKTGAERFKLNGHGKVKFAADGKRLITWGDDLYLRVWDTANGKLLAEHRTLPNGLAEKDLEDRNRLTMMMVMAPGDISDDGSTFAMNFGQSVQVYDVVTGKERAKFETDPNGTIALALSPDGKRLAIGPFAKRIEFRHNDGSRQTTSEKDHRTAVWDIAEKKCLWHAMIPGSFGRVIQFSHDGSRVAELVGTEHEPAFIWMWDAASGKDLGRIELPPMTWRFAFDRSGKKIAASHRDTTATIYDIESALKPNPPK